MKVWRDCYPFFEAFGIAHGRKDAVADILELHESQFKRTVQTWNRGRRLERREITEDGEQERFETSLRRMLITSHI